MARLRNAGAFAGRGRVEPLARAREVPGDHLPEPRRVLPDPRLRPAGAAGRRHRHGDAGRDDAAGAARRDPPAGGGTHRTRGSRVRRGAGAGPREGAHPLRGVGRSERRRPGAPRAGLPGADVPRADPAVGGPRPSVPLYLEPLAQPRRDRARSHDGGAAIRPRQGSSAAPSLRGHARRGAFRSRRAGDGGTPRPALPRHGAPGPRGVPRHAGRRRRGRGGRGGGSPRGRRKRPATAPEGGDAGPARDPPIDVRRGSRAAPPGARAGGRRRLLDRRPPRPRLPLGIAGARSARAQGGAVDAGHAGPPGRRRGRGAGHVPHPAGGRCLRPPPLRLIRDVGAGVRGASRARSERPRDQTDPLSRGRRGQRDHSRADSSGGGRASRSWRSSS